jgi:hypothetical protein
MRSEEFPEPTLVRYALPVAAWLLDHHKESYLTITGLVAMGSLMIWVPWWARLIGLAGLGVTLLGIELENVAHRMDGANTMMFLMKEHDERKRS